MTGSYVIKARVMVQGTLRSQELEQASVGLLCGYLRSLADQIEQGRGEIAMLSVEPSSAPARAMPVMSGFDDGRG